CSVSSPGNGTAILSILVSRVSRKSCRFVSRSVSITAADQRSSSVEVDGLYTHFLFALIPGDGHTNRSGTDGKERHISLGGGVNFSDHVVSATTKRGSSRVRRARASNFSCFDPCKSM